MCRVTTFVAMVSSSMWFLVVTGFLDLIGAAFLVILYCLDLLDGYSSCFVYVWGVQSFDVTLD